MLLSKLRQRLEREEGFTLIELLVVLVIIAVLLAIAVPSYLGFKERAEKRAAQSNIRAALPAAEAYYSDVGNYTGISNSALRASYDQGLSTSLVVVAANAGKSYTMSETVGKCTANFTGPAGTSNITVNCV
jgi:type IV pilus assembly protein PilA